MNKIRIKSLFSVYIYDFFFHFEKVIFHVFLCVCDNQSLIETAQQKKK